jgi:hypothetical protein
MISEEAQIELAKNAIPLLTAIFVGLATLIGQVINGILTIRNGKKTDILKDQMNGALTALEKARLVASEQLTKQMVKTARINEQIKAGDMAAALALSEAVDKADLAAENAALIAQYKEELRQGAEREAKGKQEGP